MIRFTIIEIFEFRIFTDVLSMALLGSHTTKLGNNKPDKSLASLDGGFFCSLNRLELDAFLYRISEREGFVMRQELRYFRQLFECLAGSSHELLGNYCGRYKCKVNVLRC